MPVVTAVRVLGARAAIELDGAPWRTLPHAAVVEAGLAVGVTLDRARARTLARAARRHRAEVAVLGALARRDHSVASLDARLVRAGVREPERRDVVERAQRAGLVDDARFAEVRARTLADRGKGDALILDDLVRSGVAERDARAAVAVLEPEPARAARIVAQRGVSIRTARFLATRGFTEETVGEVVADLES
jgi:SOS response regulatory protein OraA/RecX